MQAPAFRRGVMTPFIPQRSPTHTITQSSLEVMRGKDPGLLLAYLNQLSSPERNDLRLPFPAAQIQPHSPTSSATAPGTWLQQLGFYPQPSHQPPERLTRMQWDVLKGLLYALGLFALISPATLILYLALIPMYFLVDRARRFDEALPPELSAQQLNTQAPSAAAPALTPGLTPSFEDVRLHARMSSLEDTERELLTLREASLQRNMPELTAELDQSLHDVQQLKADLSLQERQELRERSATIGAYLRQLKEEHPPQQEGKLKL